MLHKKCAETLHSFIRYMISDHVADYKRLRGGVEFIKEIPRSPSGKILRKILKDELASSQPS